MKRTGCPTPSLRQWLLALAAATLLGACGGGGGGESGGSASSEPAPATAPTSDGPLAQAADCGLPDFQADWLAQVNARRTAGAVCGARTFAAAGALTAQALLQEAADGHSRDMAANGFMGHVSSDGRSMVDRVNQAGYGWSRLAENVAQGHGSVSSVMSGWMSSEGHCANIMHPQLQHIAVACVRAETSGQRPYWTMKLARPD